MLAWYAAAPDRLKFLRTVQEFRYIIEPEAAALAAERRSDAQMSGDQPSLQRHGRGATLLSERTEADTRFHVAILRASGNELLVPLGVLIEFGPRKSVRLRHARGERSRNMRRSCTRTSRSCVRLQRREAARRAVRRLLATTDEIIGRASL